VEFRSQSGTRDRHILRSIIKTAIGHQRRPAHLGRKSQVKHRHGNILIRVISVTQLPVLIVTTGPQRPIALDRKTLVAHRKSRDVTNTRIRNRTEPVYGRPISQLSKIILTPYPHTPIRFDGITTVGLRSNGHHLTQPRHLHRQVTRGLISHSQLTPRIISPRPHSPITLQCNHVIVSRRNRHDFKHAIDLLRHTQVRTASIAQLSKVILSPRPHAPITFQRHAELVGSRSHRNHIGQAKSLDR